MPLSKIVPMRLGRFSVFDDRDVSAENLQVLKSICYRGNFRLLRMTQIPDLPLCGAPSIDRGVARFTERTDPRQTWEEFVADGGLVFGDSDFDPRKPFMLLSVFLDGEPHGIFTIINMEIESDTPVQIQASGYGVYLSNANPADVIPREWGFFVRELLDRDVRMEDGRILDITQWNFPTDMPWIENDAPEAMISRTVLGEIRRAGTAETKHGASEGVQRLRRRTAPRPIPLPVLVTDRAPELPDRVEIPEETDRDIPTRPRLAVAEVVRP